MQAQVRRAGRSLALPLLLLAVLLQADAVVKSTVMNLVGMGMGGVAGSMSMCSGPMAGMDEATTQAEAEAAPLTPDHRFDTAQHHKAMCSYCAAAAHAPTLSLAEPARPSCAVAFTAFLQTAAHGPRGPPALTPRARGPPPTA